MNIHHLPSREKPNSTSSNPDELMEVQYDSQIVAIGKKAAKLNLNVSACLNFNVQPLPWTFEADPCYFSFRKSATTTTPATQLPSDPSPTHASPKFTINS
jgi:hypothetical protein